MRWFVAQLVALAEREELLWSPFLSSVMPSRLGSGPAERPFLKAFAVRALRLLS
jgi:hypothetical protein